MTELTIQLDETLKADAETVFGQIGLNVSEAVKLFFTQTVLERALPFTPLNEKAENAETDDEAYDRYFNPVNLARLKESEEQVKRGEVITFTIEEWEEYTKC
ncbi:MAG: type II toxin-antitoxin system RelB/DinJ family antitoxin [Defluviitaleaceae bacterium]|nr:type II toxin-antitoxin system RelB/DinJ family antitoxin [Defluviitaleaceae bacterium]